MSLQGGCLCGAVRFAVEGEAKWCATCHCSMCRRAHGAGAVAWVGVPADAFRVTSGRDALRAFASSPEGKRSFCGTCGSPLFFESARWPGEVHIALAHIEGAHGLTPRANVFFDDRAPWVHVDDGLPRRGGPTGTAPIG